MTQLVALLSTGKGTWSQVIQLINQEDWEKVILITNTFGKENFKKQENTELVLIDADRDVQDIMEVLKLKLAPLVSGTDVALNLVSGSGKEHMAVLAALLKLGLGIRLVAPGENQVREL